MYNFGALQAFCLPLRKTFPSDRRKALERAAGVAFKG
jgi:hypothetical protein